MDSLINFDANSILHSIASKAITTHLVEKEILKENETKVGNSKTSQYSNKDNNIIKKNVSFTSRNLKTTKTSMLGLKKN